MKRLLLLLLLFTATLPMAATAQNTAYGDRVPTIKKGIKWLENQAPADSEYTFIHFCSVKSPASTDCIRTLNEIGESSGGRLCVVVIGREEDERLLPIVRDLLSPHLVAIADPNRKIFDSFNVNFVPFGILVDSHNKTIWMGNPTQERQTIIDLIQ